MTEPEPSSGPTRRIVVRSARLVVRSLVQAAIGGLVVLIVVFVIGLERRPDLSIWHEATLDQEFTAEADVTTLREYLDLEDRLFVQLDELVYDARDAAPARAILRYHRGSLADPTSRPRNWNRTFELKSDTPRAGVLMLHGLSDSPYSMRSLAESLHAEGYQVLGLRIPGHGTAPSGLLRTSWEDMAAAVELAAHHLDQQVGDRPIHLVGYSNGAALALHYALTALDDPDLPAPGRLVLISPEIGISKLAGLAVWQERLGRLLGLRKLAWNSIKLEYDPYKYQSFALNAGKQAHRLTGAIRTRIQHLAPSGALERMPPVIAFQSVVDSTVSTPAVVRDLFDPLPRGGHELVLFDINRLREVGPILAHDPVESLATLLRRSRPSFVLTAVTNENEITRDVVEKRWLIDSNDPVISPLDLAWPSGIYSLSHVALPFSPDDPLYGSGPFDDDDLHLGNLALYGERGLINIPASDILRLRWNPFYEYLESRVLEFYAATETATR
jgi:alpha-beta hydrolase superfamily lysophospholipase